MTTKTKTQEIDYTGDVSGRVGYEEAQWSYPGIGPNFKRNVFYKDDEELKELEVIPLAVRQYKQVSLGENKARRLSMYKKEGDPRMQLVLVLASDPTKIYNLGTGAYTGRASFFNTDKDGGWHNSDLPVGVMVALKQHIDQIAAEQGVRTPYNAWKMTLKFSDEEVTVGSGRNAQQVRPIVVEGDFEYVGNDLARQLDQLYEREDLNAWVRQYEDGNDEEEVLENANAPEQPTVDYSEFTENDEIPF